MAQTNNTKKRVIISYKNLPEELQEQLKLQHPTGFTDSMIRIDKGPGDFFYAVILETDEINYLVKIDVKIDSEIEEEDEKDYYDEDINGADQIEEASDEDEN
ncbi:MAG: hypothetical protein E7128_01050 [Rikenellaceae bacterium]|nr:hypothetical protein [Rikenellaceae bacterium]MBR2451988.1 hypothetical protein [Rikenellaceae bacterium]